MAAITEDDDGMAAIGGVKIAASFAGDEADDTMTATNIPPPSARPWRLFVVTADDRVFIVPDGGAS